MVYVDELGGEVTVRVHYWIENPGRQDILIVQSEYARRIKRRFENEGITIGPTSEIELSGRIGIDDSGGVGEPLRSSGSRRVAPASDTRTTPTQRLYVGRESL